jgi:hypothetical protein
MGDARRRPCFGRASGEMIDRAIVDALVNRLVDPANSEPASAFPADSVAAAHPGLYSWWGDDEALSLLSRRFGVRMPALIYAGQAGATSTRSRRVRIATLQSRICSNHLGGNVGSSTFRKTLTALLLQPLGLRLSRPGCLEKASNDALSDWIRVHLRVVIAPYPDRDQLAEVEAIVLGRIDPPLNLKGMPLTLTRATLSALRSQLG